MSLAIILASGSLAFLIPAWADAEQPLMKVPFLRVILVFAFALGLAAGAILKCEEAGEGPGFSRGPEAEARFSESNRAGELHALTVVGASGRLAADSSPPRKGSRFYTLNVEELELAGPGISATAQAKGGLRVMVIRGPSLEAGAHLKVSSARLLPNGDGLLVASAASMAASQAPGFLARLRHILRSAFIAALDRAGGGGASSGLLEALLSGSRDELDAEEALAYKRAGCAHILSLSGQHLSILAAALGLILKPLFGPLRARTASLGVIALFVFVAGPEPALLRSIIMYGLAYFAVAIDRPQDARSIIGLSFAIQAFMDPSGARGLSFLLSYLAMVGLVVLEPRFEHLFLAVLPPPLAAALAASFAAQAATAPLVAFAFGSLYPIGIIASIVSGPLVAAFIWWGLAAALVCGPFPAASAIVAPVTRLIHAALAATMDFFAAAPSLALSGAGIPLAAVGVVLGAAFVYALPYAEYRRGLRRSRSPSQPPRGGGPGHVQAVRTKLPREPERA